MLDLSVISEESYDDTSETVDWEVAGNIESVSSEHVSGSECSIEFIDDPVRTYDFDKIVQDVQR